MRINKPDIEGLEKFMDYGFMLSILKTEYFPPLDHYLAAEPINYYYFGHLIAALITQIAKVPPGMGYNFQMSNILALGLAESFSIGMMFYQQLAGMDVSDVRRRWSLWAGTLSSTFVMLVVIFTILSSNYLLSFSSKTFF